MARKGGARSGAARGGGGAPAPRFGNADISDDEVDAFHTQRDKILLDDQDDDAAGGQRDPYDALAPGGRSVLDVREAETDSDEGTDEGASGEDGEDEDEDEESFLPPLASTSSKAAGKAASARRHDGDEEEEDDVDEDASAAEDDGPTSGWGPNKRAYYSTNDLDDLESDSEMDEDEKREMELREVRKLQTKSRQGLEDDDFGLGGDNSARDVSAAAREQRRKDLDVEHDKARVPAPATLSSSSGQSVTQSQLAPAELLAKVQRQTPETMALVGEYADVVDDLAKAGVRMHKLLKENPDHPSLGLLHLHHQTLMTYVAMLTFYFHRRAADTSTSGSMRPSNTDIVERLVKLKTGLSALEDFGLGLDGGDDPDSDAEEGEEEEMEDEDDEEEEDLQDARVNFLFKPPNVLDHDTDDDGSASLGSLDEDELMQLEAEEKENHAKRAEAPKPKKAKAANGSSTQGDGTSKKAKKSKRSDKEKGTKKERPTAPLAGVAGMVEADELNEVPAAKRRKRTDPATGASGAASDVYGEPTSLGAADSADKEARRRSLKFYTGQIDARDGRQGKSALQGDMDIPYRDKERSRQAVANANAAKEAKASGVPFGRGRDLDASDFGEEDALAYRDIMDDADGSLPSAHGTAANRRGGGSDDHDNDNGDEGAGYYDLVTRRRKAERQVRKEEHDEARAAERVAPDDAQLEPGEHRGINRAIEKNKGLMAARRPKSVRNPRVKKRMRYEKAQKKLSSRGPVYKGGQASLQGGYGGETSGISSHVVKSRQFA